MKMSYFNSLPIKSSKLRMANNAGYISFQKVPILFAFGPAQETYTCPMEDT